MMSADYIVSTEYDGKARKLYAKQCACGTTFHVPKHRYDEVKSCSPECRGLLRRKRVSVECANCGASLERTQSAVLNSKNGKFFCNRECKEFAQSLKGDCAEIRPTHYGTAKIPHYRGLVELDRCACCPTTEKYLLVVHHIDGDRENNAPSNLKVLCFNCHGRHHLYQVDGEWIYNTKVLTPPEKLAEFGDVM